MILAAFNPTSVPDRRASRNMSPVDNCTIDRRLIRIFAWVPFPDPGGPSRTMFI